MPTQDEIEKLVNKVAKAALQEDVEGQGISFQDRVDALKVLTPYYLALKKDRGTEDSGGSTMADFAQSMKEQPEHAPQVRGHRGRQ